EKQSDWSVSLARTKEAFLRDLRASFANFAVKSFALSPRNLLFRELHFQSQRIRKAIGQICKAGQQMQIDNLRIVEVLLQRSEVRVVHGMRVASKLFRVSNGRSLLFGEARIVAGLQRFPVIRGQAGALG